MLKILHLLKKKRWTRSERSMLFNLIRYVLEYETVAIRRVARLRDPDDRKQELWGYFRNDRIYFADGLAKSNEGKTVIHEILHSCLNDGGSMEKLIVSSESRIWNGLAKDQKELILKFSGEAKKIKAVRKTRE